ncbi:MAG: ABC transporter ATP-binding protein [Planctomycetes bacterium]|nr:ABC transporter ATP-binding protein [Planctomycetota bacterium]
MSLLEVSHLKKSYNGAHAVDDVSFAVEAGEILGLLGPNGAGKTTTMMIIAGLLEPDSGTVSVDGLVGRKRRMALGIVPQNLAVYDELTAVENLRFFGSLYGVRGAALKRRCEAVLDLAGLLPHANNLVGTFSGGMKRRLNLAIGLLHEPKLLILDEPTVGVDPQSRSHLLERVREFARAGVAVLYASHYMDEVQTICDRVAILDHGRMLTAGTLDSLLHRVHACTTVRVEGLTTENAKRLGESFDLRRTGDSRAEIVTQHNVNGGAANLGGRLARLFGTLDECGVTVEGIESRESDLEQLFLDLTGRHLRD